MGHAQVLMPGGSFRGLTSWGRIVDVQYCAYCRLRTSLGVYPGATANGFNLFELCREFCGAETLSMP